MENTTAPTAPAPAIPGPTNQKLLVFTGLLILGTIFWLWSISYRNNHHMMENGRMMQNDQQMDLPMTQETDLNNEIDASLTSNSEIELRGIDEEF